MEERDITPQQIMDAFHVKQGTVSDWMRDRRGLPEGPTILKFAKFLRVSVEEFFVDVDDEYEEIRRSLSKSAAADGSTEAEQFLALPPPLRRWLIGAGPDLWESLQRATQAPEPERGQPASRSAKRRSTQRP